MGHALGCSPPVAIDHHPGFKKAGDQTQHPLVPDADPQQLNQLVVVDFVKERANVAVRNEVHFLGVDVMAECFQSIVTRATGPKPVGVVMKVDFVDSLQYHHDRALDNLALDARDAQWALSWM